ncbi:hypothetical protein [Botrimarina sp.]|uniref:hypothetical protein n=1 Tax=Botrimarina sp. TaxID=2795802 RepID=UPI0032ECD33A
MRNARFWTIHNGAPVKLTLRPGQQLTHASGGACEEGYACEFTLWVHDADHACVTRCCESWGTDCDGGWDRSDDSIAALDALDALEPCGGFPELRGLRFPRWQRLDGWQRDHAAELAGY